MCVCVCTFMHVRAWSEEVVRARTCTCTCAYVLRMHAHALLAHNFCVERSTCQYLSIAIERVDIKTICMHAQTICKLQLLMEELECACVHCNRVVCHSSLLSIDIDIDIDINASHLAIQSPRAICWSHLLAAGVPAVRDPSTSWPFSTRTVDCCRFCGHLLVRWCHCRWTGRGMPPRSWPRTWPWISIHATWEAP
jgi:hypothetical protein